MALKAFGDKVKLLVLFVTAIILVHSNLIFASENSHKAAAEKMMEAMQMEKGMSNMSVELLQSQLAADPCLLPYKDILKEFYQKTLSWPVFKENVAKIYVREFTEDEMNEIARFYATPIGKKMLEKLPKLTVEGIQLGQKSASEHQQELNDKIGEAYKKLDPKTFTPECKARFEKITN